ncbi:MAG: twin-arginine translocase TatA/TatE family subunit [Candidatus Hinthialibacter antarcticus]|nr:twin-arginine translocase TatA/TatE family subunit [Candidatus Hinthialibacter antarcticus]
MLGIGTSELVVLLGVALMVFGPQKLPELARLLAKATKMFNDASREIQRQLEMSEREIREAERKVTLTEKPKSEIDMDSDPYAETYGEGTEQYGYDSGYESGQTIPAGDAVDAEAISEPETHDIDGGNGNDEAPKTAQPMDDPDKIDDANRLSREMSD